MMDNCIFKEVNNMKAQNSPKTCERGKLDLFSFPSRSTRVFPFPPFSMDNQTQREKDILPLLSIPSLSTYLFLSQIFHLYQKKGLCNTLDPSYGNFVLFAVFLSFCFFFFNFVVW
jgi:hypothetical protein